MNAVSIFGRARFNRNPQPAPRAGGNRRALLGKVHLAAKELQLSEDDYRAILFDVTSHASAAKCNEKQLVDVIERFKARGWKPAVPAGKASRLRVADHPSAKKARALWISLHHLGAIGDPSEAALEAFAKRQVPGCTKLQWADQALCYKLIEAEKAMAQRHGWDQDLAGVKPEAKVIVLKRRLVDTIFQRLIAEKIAPEDWSIERATFEFSGTRLSTLLIASAEDLDLIARELGRTLREAVK